MALRSRTLPTLLAVAAAASRGIRRRLVVAGLVEMRPVVAVVGIGPVAIVGIRPVAIIVGIVAIAKMALWISIEVRSLSGTVSVVV